MRPFPSVHRNISDTLNVILQLVRYNTEMQTLIGAILDTTTHNGLFREMESRKFEGKALKNVQQYVFA